MQDIDIAMEAARHGAGVLLKYWEKIGKEDADLKARNDWVSNADRESETAIRRCIAASFPSDRILGEESGMSSGERDNGRTWIVDPLDGTSNYLQHFPVWSISIALKRGDELVAGLIYEPLRDIFYTAELGGGAFRNRERLRVSSQRSVEGSFLATGFPFRAQQFVGIYCQIFQDLIRIAKGVRRAGSAALDLAYTAAGTFDGFFELDLAPWDVAAGALIVREAGGIVTDFSGGNRWLERGNIVGAAPRVHEDLIRMIGRYASEDQLDRGAPDRIFVPDLAS
ncbi:MAG TPA: inositol monophosphatase family protein [Thermoanaerobaculia bacterium]|nr:inositol monophosphatase family protein [Thermoanaerobaculia bacterium]